METEELRLAFIGFGSANRALARLLLEKSERPADDPRRHLRAGTRLVPWRATCLATRTRGRVVAASPQQSIDLAAALRRVEAGGRLDRSLVVGERSETALAPRLPERVAKTCDFDACATADLVALLGEHRIANVVVEAIPSNPRGRGEPALSIVRTALSSKMHVVSANKTSLAHRTPDGEEVYWKLQQIARANGVRYYHESAVSAMQKSLACLS